MDPRLISLQNAQNFLQNDIDPFCASSQLFKGGATLVLAFHFYKMEHKLSVLIWVNLTHTRPHGIELA